jgi:hypothetical protein
MQSRGIGHSWTDFGEMPRFKGILFSRGYKQRYYIPTALDFQILFLSIELPTLWTYAISSVVCVRYLRNTCKSACLYKPKGFKLTRIYRQSLAF